jgi:hypothetical protein
VERLNHTTGKFPASILLDKKYENIRTEAIHSGILLKQIDEKIDEIITDGHTIKSHAYDIQSNARKFYQNLIRSEKFLRYCLLIFIIFMIMIAMIFIGKFFVRKSN